MSASEVPPKDIPAVNTHSEDPSKALDQLAGEPSILDKAREMAKPVSHKHTALNTDYVSGY